MGLGETEAPDEITARHRGEVLLLLRFRSERVDRIHAERGLDGNEAAKPGVSTLDLLADQPVRDRVQARAAVPFQ